MKAVFGDDALHAAGADLPAALAQLLGDHLRGGVAVEEPVPDHLPDDLGRSPVVCLGAALLTPQSDRARFVKEGAELEVPLLAVAELAGGLEGAAFLALPFQEHEQLLRDLVVRADAQGAGRPDPRMVFQFESCHLGFLRKARRLPGPRGPSVGRP